MIPLSFGQLGLWFIHQMNPGSSMYTMQLASRLTGQLDSTALEEALRDVVQRHESLRTVIRDGEGMPHQVVLDISECGVRLEYEELSEEELHQAMHECSEHPFDLVRDLPLRAWLFALGPLEHVLLISMHHIVSDGWSLGPLTRDLARAYEARRRGAEPNMPPLPVQYADYTLWQRQLLGREEDPDSLASRQLAHWRSVLDGIPQELRLPADHPRRPMSDFAGGTIEFTLDADLHRALVEVARTENATMFMVLQAGFAALLSKLGAGTDIPIGSPVAGRMDDALTDLIGYFVNMLVFRVDVSGDPGLRDLVKRVQTVALDAYENQDIPFDRLVTALNPARSRTRHPLFQVMFTLESDADAGLKFDGLTDVPLDIDGGSSMFDLALSLRENFGPDKEPAGMDVFLEYQLDMFERETAQHMADGYRRMVAALAADSDAPISTVDLPMNSARTQS
ncbi:condensation domain-containing protein [Streptomyces anulatus]|uniref:Condensation domain-containing protein n=1 Tax=Streptomyces anulatus TaxID=1892 RepID=A0ABZ1ZDL6_STRAQ|nr:condensation domain-containing protein [Streptomyces anulatus]